MASFVILLTFQPGLCHMSETLGPKSGEIDSVH